MSKTSFLFSYVLALGEGREGGYEHITNLNQLNPQERPR
jgi:hypothetical protein